MPRFALRGVAVFYLLAVLLGPLAMVFYRAFERGLDPLRSSLTDRPERLLPPGPGESESDGKGGHQRENRVLRFNRVAPTGVPRTGVLHGGHLGPSVSPPPRCAVRRLPGKK